MDISAIQATRKFKQHSNNTVYSVAGTEVEFGHVVNDNLKFSANYSYQESKNQTANDDVGFAPNNQAYARADWTFSSNWYANAEIHWFGRIQRALFDNRPPVKSDSVWNLTFSRTNLWKGCELALSVRNLFDSQWRTPSWTRVEYDYPAPGRNGDISLRYVF